MFGATVGCILVGKSHEKRTSRVPDALQRYTGDVKHRPVVLPADPGLVPASSQTHGPDQQRTTPQARRVAQHPGHDAAPLSFKACGLISKES
jgi:hypothetical protein